jgi:hypothetical protein
LPTCQRPPGAVQGHPCYNASKDLVIPAFKPPSMWESSPYLHQNFSKKPLQAKRIRDILTFFRGDMGGALARTSCDTSHLTPPCCIDSCPKMPVQANQPAARQPAAPLREARQPAAHAHSHTRRLVPAAAGEHRLPWYSRGIRQRLHQLAKKDEWAAAHRIWIGTSRELEGQYGDLLARSVFCLVMPGELLPPCLAPLPPSPPSPAGYFASGCSPQALRPGKLPPAPPCSPLCIPFRELRGARRCLGQRPGRAASAQPPAVPPSPSSPLAPRCWRKGGAWPLAASP